MEFLGAGVISVYFFLFLAKLFLVCLEGFGMDLTGQGGTWSRNSNE